MSDEIGGAGFQPDKVGEEISNPRTERTTTGQGLPWKNLYQEYTNGVVTYCEDRAEVLGGYIYRFYTRYETRGRTEHCEHSVFVPELPIA